MSRNLVIIVIMSMNIVLAACAGNPASQASLEHEADKTARLNLELGIAYMNENENEKAMKKLQKAIKLDPQYADAHNAIAILFDRLKQHDKARTHYERAVQLAPTDSNALNNYGQFLCSQGEPEKAEKMFLRALEDPLYRTPHFAYLNAGICAKESGNYEQAEMYFRKALGKHPEMAVALYQMADISYLLKRYMPARGYLQRFADVTDHNASSLWLAVRVERALGDRDAASSFALRLKNTFPDSQETGLLLKAEDK